MGCYNLPYQKNNLEVNKNYFKKELTSKRSLDIDYSKYLFGQIQPGRSFTSSSYRFGFNGKEKENDITGVDGGHLDFGARIYDSRLGRWLSTDPMSAFFPTMSAYQFAGNSPIYIVDNKGEENMIYLYINTESSSFLSKTSVNEIYSKVLKVFARIYNENPQLKVAFGIKLVNNIISYEELDESDVMIAVTTTEELNNNSTFFSYKVPIVFKSYPEGVTPTNNTDIPAVQPPSEKDRETVKKVSPNLTDQIAYELVHEFFHKLEVNMGYFKNIKSNTSDGHTTDKTLMSSAQNVGVPTKKIEDMSSYRFKLNDDWLKFINENYKKRIQFNSSTSTRFKVKGIPRDNRGNKKDKSEPHIIFNPRF